MPFLLHTVRLEADCLLIMRSSLLFADNSQSPPRSPYPDMVSLRLFQILRFFLIHCLIGQFASSHTKCPLLTDFFMLNLVFLSDSLFSLSSCCITAALQRERCWKVLSVGSLYFWWTSMLTPLSWSMDTMSYVLCFSLNLALCFSLSSSLSPPKLDLRNTSL